MTADHTTMSRRRSDSQWWSSARWKAVVLVASSATTRPSREISQRWGSTRRIR